MIRLRIISTFVIYNEERTEGTKEQFAIVVTGFGPFGSQRINASWEAVKRLTQIWKETKRNDNILLITEEIPVSYEFVQEQVPKKWCSNKKQVQTKVQVMIHVGVRNVKRVTIEDRANNFGYSIPDINGKTPDNGRCVSVCNGDVYHMNGAGLIMPCTENICLSTAFDVDKIVEYLNHSLGEGISEKSRDAGHYLCEFVYFKSLYTMDRRSLFIHVPTLDVVSAEQSADAIKLIIEYISKSLS